ncbi:hypothetical protein C8Q70DRAFT_699554 [Cubamyces menziesii]|nr:hypothetical protein C8Q70DRAFT_699554 [Cubamyces menziesii]
MGAERHADEFAAALGGSAVGRPTPTPVVTTRANKAVARAHLEIELPCWRARDKQGREYRALVARLRSRCRRTIEQLEQYLGSYGRLVYRCECCVPVQHKDLNVQGDVDGGDDGEDDDQDEGAGADADADEGAGEAPEQEYESEEDMPLPKSTAAPQHRHTEEGDAASAPRNDRGDSLFSDSSLTEFDSGSDAEEQERGLDDHAHAPGRSESPDVPLAQVVARLRARRGPGSAGGLGGLVAARETAEPAARASAVREAPVSRSVSVARPALQGGGAFSSWGSSATVAASSASVAHERPSHSRLRLIIKEEHEEILPLASSGSAVRVDPRTMATTSSSTSTSALPPAPQPEPSINDFGSYPGSDSPRCELPFLDSSGIDFDDLFQEDLPWITGVSGSAACPTLYPRATENGPGAFYGGFDGDRFL